MNSAIAWPAALAIVIVAAIHVYIMVLEMWLWTRPAGRRAFGLSAEFAAASRVLAANQGLYNGFLAAGLLWSVLPGSPSGIAGFFLGCVLVAGLYGGATASRKILLIQALPAALALGLLQL